MSPWALTAFSGCSIRNDQRRLPAAKYDMDLLLRLEKVAGGILLAALTIAIFIQVLFRFVIDLPLAWSEELSRYSFIWLTMLVAPICIRLKANISTGTLGLLPRRAALIVELLGYLLAFAFIAVLLIWGTALMNLVRFQHSPAMGIPMNLVYAAVPVGATLMMVEIVALITATIRKLMHAPGLDRL